MLEQMGRPGVEDLPIAEGRQGMAAMGKLAEADPVDLAVIRDLTCPGPAGDIPLRLYDTKDTREAGPVVVFMHGGGFVIGDLEIYHSLCTHICERLDLPVVSVDYRLAPEAPFPAAPDDCEAAMRWIAGSPEALGREVTGLIPMGDSAGGNLTIVVTNQLTAEPAAVPVIMQAPIYPVADDVSQHQSFRDFGEGYLLTHKTMAFFTEQYAADPADPRNVPMAGEHASFPPTVLCTAGLDPLRDSGRNYAAHLIQQGIDVSYLEFPGTIHGFMTLRKALPSAQGDLDAMLAAMQAMLARIEGKNI
ncbi:alpha/beta hydrolase [Altererythrobacter sp. HHU K3-1]|uniref:Alpha/beta hydrolase n=2 Tax=Qipengyuania atrilutea TaxID=2744473 RepID=A0A850GZX5_9SPHN|nr:alpha/beta hydrolase [Actirhodobacter atriluteus]